MAGGGWRLGPCGKAFAVLGGRRFGRRLAAYVGGVWAACSAALAGGACFGLAAFGVCGLAAWRRRVGGRRVAACRAVCGGRWRGVSAGGKLQNAIARLRSQWLCNDWAGVPPARSFARSRLKSGKVRANTSAYGGHTAQKTGCQTLKNGLKSHYSKQSGESIQAPTKRLYKPKTPAANGGGADARQGGAAAGGGGGAVGQIAKNCCKKMEKWAKNQDKKIFK